jgi:PAS domain S-box-containing protein/putative nucleotidyltransferase with HDIG domain
MNATPRTKDTKREQLDYKKLFKDLVERAGIAILIDDRIGNFKYINKKYAEFFGYSPSEMKKLTIREVVHPDDVDMVMKYHEGRINGKRVPSVYDFKGIKKDGSTIYLEVTSQLIKRGGKSVGTRSFITEITERKTLEEDRTYVLRLLRKTADTIIQVICKLVEIRDPYIGSHQRRVADLARAIAQDMKLPREKVDGIRIAALIHDIGKISTPAEILSKPGRLNEAEFELIKNHPGYAYNILKTIDFPWPIAEIIYQHHERLDGSGYPRALTDKNILLEAKIIGVADVVEAMTSHRPYRPSLGIDAALEELRRNTGILYDPDVVKACLRLFRKNEFEFRLEAPGPGPAAAGVAVR